MIEINSALLGGVVVALLGGLGWLVKRHISGEHNREKASLYAIYASIAGTMKAQGLQEEDIEAIAASLASKKRFSSSSEPVPSIRNANAEVSDNIPAYWTQAAMNARANAAASVANAQLDAALVEIYTILSEDEAEYFEATQKA